MDNKIAHEDYRSLLSDLKQRIRTAQIKAAVSVNKKMIQLYWDIGHRILTRQSDEGWGKSVVERLSRDLRREFPEMKGFSPRNLWDMRRFSEAYPDESNLRQLVAQIPWGHNLALLNSVKDTVEREWYIHQTVENGWSRSVLVHQIETKLYGRQGTAATNFAKTLPPPQSDLAHQALKDPYIFDFLTLDKEAHERDLEQGLVEHIRDFLVELGVGFAFVGRQVHLAVGDQDFFVDLLFYHLKLRCYVVIELKAAAFKPEYAGKLNFYLSAVDDLMRHPEDKPTIGIIICKTKDNIVAEYALRDMNKPMGISEYETQLTESLPQTLKGSLPEIKDLEAELAGE
jgi:predicted nuclease of restriction endonuclease-like (RecB) superfamily